jgi:hypothetical protein
MRPSA